jgi:DNA-binding PadR family transcriptional regulator
MPKTAKEEGKPLTPVAVQILLSLSQKDLHGYGIKLEIEERTRGVMRLGSGTLYEAIQRLERDGRIVETTHPDAETSGRKKRYYGLTPLGRENLGKELLELDAIVAFARNRNLIPESRTV